MIRRLLALPALVAIDITAQTCRGGERKLAAAGSRLLFGKGGDCDGYVSTTRPVLPPPVLGDCGL